MSIGIYCANFTQPNLEAVQVLIDELKQRKLSYVLFRNLADHLTLQNETTFHDQDSAIEKLKFLTTVGGDGTILSAIRLVAGKDIPVLGINTGRLGFLTSVTLSEIGDALQSIDSGNYKIEERALLELEARPETNILQENALNEISVLKKDSSSMITIHAKLDGEFLNTYWADGLIISTATGSTAYSMSCGGPIVLPGSGNLIITPIAPHNLNVRPIVIPDTSLLELTFEARSGDLLIALDSTSVVIPEQTTIKVKKASYGIQLLRLGPYSYLETLRTKLNWGLDKRN